MPSGLRTACMSSTRRAGVTIRCRPTTMAFCAAVGPASASAGPISWFSANESIWSARIVDDSSTTRWSPGASSTRTRGESWSVPPGSGATQCTRGSVPGCPGTRSTCLAARSGQVPPHGRSSCTSSSSSPGSDSSAERRRVRQHRRRVDPDRRLTGPAIGERAGDPGEPRARPQAAARRVARRRRTSCRGAMSILLSFAGVGRVPLDLRQDEGFRGTAVSKPSPLAPSPLPTPTRRAVQRW